MISLGSKLVCALVAAALVAGLSAQAYGSGGFGPTAGDCCCQVEPPSNVETTCGEPDNGCCPGEPKQSDDSPCSCACPTCGVMVRTINLFSAEGDLALLFSQDAKRLTLMPARLPASAVLGVDIQPPIA